MKIQKIPRLMSVVTKDAVLMTLFKVSLRVSKKVGVVTDNYKNGECSFTMILCALDQLKILKILFLKS